MRTTNSQLSKYRDTTHPTYKTTDSDGMNGLFRIPLAKRMYASVLSGEGIPEMPWEHVSVRIIRVHGKKWFERTPTWDEMCLIKSLFWDDDEAVMQLHPAASEYVNIHEHVLHLWKPLVEKIPLPPRKAV
jgi:hypothetical protein